MAVHQATDKRRDYAHRQGTESIAEGDFGTTPAKLLAQGLDEHPQGKSEDWRRAQHQPHHRGEHDPPAVKDSATLWHYYHRSAYRLTRSRCRRKFSVSSTA